MLLSLSAPNGTEKLEDFASHFHYIVTSLKEINFWKENHA